MSNRSAKKKLENVKEPFSASTKVPDWCESYVKKPVSELPKCIQQKTSTIQQSLEEEELYTLMNRDYLDSTRVLERLKPIIKPIPPHSLASTVSRPYDDYLLYETVVRYCTRLFSFYNRTPYTLFYHKLLQPMSMLVPTVANLTHTKYDCYPDRKISDTSTHCPFDTDSPTLCNKYWHLCDKGAHSVQMNEVTYICPPPPTCYFGEKSSQDCKDFEAICQQKYIVMEFVMYILQEFSELGFVVQVKGMYDVAKDNTIIYSIMIPNTFKACDTYITEASNQRTRYILPVPDRQGVSEYASTYR